MNNFDTVKAIEVLLSADGSKAWAEDILKMQITGFNSAITAFIKMCEVQINEALSSDRHEGCGVDLFFKSLGTNEWISSGQLNDLRASKSKTNDWLETKGENLWLMDPDVILFMAILATATDWESLFSLCYDEIRIRLEKKFMNDKTFTKENFKDIIRYLIPILAKSDKFAALCADYLSKYTLGDN